MTITSYNNLSTHSLFVTILSLLVCAPVFAQSPNPALNAKQLEAFSNLQMEFTTCLAYLNHLKSCSPQEMEGDTAKQVDPALKFMSKMSFDIGNMIGMTQDAMMARYKIALQVQMEAMKKSCINFSSLYAQHSARCKRLGENADSIYREYLNK